MVNMGGPAAAGFYHCLGLDDADVIKDVWTMFGPKNVHLFVSRYMGTTFFGLQNNLIATRWCPHTVLSWFINPIN